MSKANCPWCGEEMRASGGRPEWFAVCGTEGCYVIGPQRATEAEALDAMRLVSCVRPEKATTDPELRLIGTCRACDCWTFLDPSNTLCDDCNPKKKENTSGARSDDRHRQERSAASPAMDEEPQPDPG